MNTFENTLNITENAINRVKDLQKSGNENKKLRVYITGGGCSGFQYGFNFEVNSNENDVHIEKLGISVVVDPISLQYLKGSTVDFQKNLLGSRFIVSNPNAKTTCSCGSSFST